MTDNQKTILQKLARKVEEEFGMGGLSAGLYFDFACEVALRFHKRMKAEPKIPITERKSIFKNDVNEAGGMTYTKKMLEAFVDYWAEEGELKMRFEQEKTFEIPLRLKKWARNNHEKIVCYLTESEKTIKQRQEELKEQLRVFVGRYDRNLLNAFYKHWGQPENKPNPERLRWQLESWWDLETRVSQWKERQVNGQAPQPVRLSNSPLENLNRFNQAPKN